VIEEPIAFIGDIHGMARPLELVLGKLGGTRHLVFLGDYVNRGPDSKAVLQLLVEAKEEWPRAVTLLRGNHDQSLLDFVADQDVARFARLGGLSTVASYTREVRDGGVIGAFFSSFPTAHRELLHGLSDYFERGDVFASHCGFNPERPLSRTRNDVATGSHPDLFHVDARVLLGKSVVCGHYVQRSMTTYQDRGLFAIDTGCGSMAGGPLTALLWPEKTTIKFGGMNASGD